MKLLYNYVSNTTEIIFDYFLIATNKELKGVIQFFYVIIFQYLNIEPQIFL